MSLTFDKASCDDLKRSVHTSYRDRLPHPLSFHTLDQRFLKTGAESLDMTHLGLIHIFHNSEAGSPATALKWQSFLVNFNKPHSDMFTSQATNTPNAFSCVYFSVC